jgi:hypothetical protein
LSTGSLGRFPCPGPSTDRSSNLCSWKWSWPQDWGFRFFTEYSGTFAKSCRWSASIIERSAIPGLRALSAGYWPILVHHRLQWGNFFIWAG